MSATAKSLTVAATGAMLIAGAGFGAAWLLGEGAGMPVVAVGATMWTAGFVRWSSTWFGA